MNARRVVLYHPQYIERFRSALRNDLHEMNARHAAEHAQRMAELAELRAELAELREILAIVVSVTRQQAEADVVTLRRQLEIALARLERPGKPLH
jgi:hypothetical protein